MSDNAGHPSPFIPTLHFNHFVLKMWTRKYAYFDTHGIFQILNFSTFKNT